MRGTILFGSVLLALIATCFAQETGRQAPPSEVIGPPLVAWSQLQNPVPIPVLPTRRQQKQDGARPHQLFRQILTGTVARQGNIYILIVDGGSSATISESEEIRRYEGKHIRIAGQLDETDAVLYVEAIL